MNGQKRSRWQCGLALAALLMLAALPGSLGLAAAQGEPPAAHEEPFSVEGVESGAPAVVSYQGQVTVGGSLYTGAGYFKFAVIDATPTNYWYNDGSPLGGAQPAAAVQLTVANGLFNVLLGDTTLTNMTALPASVFGGADRWLRVWFSSDNVTFTLLALTGASRPRPMRLQAEEVKNAWALTGNAGTTPGTSFLGTRDNQALELKVNAARALRLEPNASSPNLIGGYSGNWLTSGMIGAVIGGGGNAANLNRVTDDYGTVGGGSGNQAGDNAGTSGDSRMPPSAGGRATPPAASVPPSAGAPATPPVATGHRRRGREQRRHRRAATVAGGRSNSAAGSMPQSAAATATTPARPTPPFRRGQQHGVRVPVRGRRGTVQHCRRGLRHRAGRRIQHGRGRLLLRRRPAGQGQQPGLLRLGRRHRRRLHVRHGQPVRGAGHGRGEHPDRDRGRAGERRRRLARGQRRHRQHTRRRPAGRTARQRVPVAGQRYVRCGNAIRVVNADGTVTCEAAGRRGLGADRQRGHDAGDELPGHQRQPGAGAQGERRAGLAVGAERHQPEPDRRLQRQLADQRGPRRDHRRGRRLRQLEPCHRQLQHGGRRAGEPGRR